ncbi:phosphatase 2C-like domain-containing protein [Entophlyctis helioformis]|nr:phosphatase 2C-like domain-containing protein [Entophlyctis helioformis]
MGIRARHMSMEFLNVDLDVIMGNSPVSDSPAAGLELPKQPAQPAQSEHADQLAALRSPSKPSTSKTASTASDASPLSLSLPRVDSKRPLDEGMDAAEALYDSIRNQVLAGSAASASTSAPSTSAPTPAPSTSAPATPAPATPAPAHNAMPDANDADDADDASPESSPAASPVLPVHGLPGPMDVLSPAIASPAAPAFDPPAPLRHHSLTWSVASQEGYRITDAQTRARAKLHTCIEDVHFPRLDQQQAPPVTDPHTRDFPRLSHSAMAKNGAKVFIVADGHGGHEAPHFFVGRVASNLLALLDARYWDLSLLEHRTALSAEVTSIFGILDAEYAAIKVAQYRAWVDAGAAQSKRPCDDGCTMVANIVFSEWIVNCNVGDSRTVVGAKLPWSTYAANSGAPGGGSSSSLSSTSSAPASMFTNKPARASEWIQLFSSEDHNMMHPEKVASIHANNGKFLDPQGTCFMQVDIQPFNVRGMKPYTELNGARIFRPISDAIRAVGCSHRRTLNLTATMGDLLFKIKPAILSAAPDIRFIKLEPGMDYVLVAATDGVWDHLSIQYPPAAQNDRILSYVTRAVQHVTNPVSAPSQQVQLLRGQHHAAAASAPALGASIHDPSGLADELLNAQHQQRTKLYDVLSHCSDVLVHRETEGTHLRDEGLFIPGLFRYDDATAMILYFTYAPPETVAPSAPVIKNAAPIATSNAGPNGHAHARAPSAHYQHPSPAASPGQAWFPNGGSSASGVNQGR